MDKQQIVTIVVTALITVIAKEVFMWATSLVKSTVAASTITAKLKAIFTKTNRSIMFKVLVLLFYVGVLINFSLSESTPTRFEILLIIGSSFAIIFVSLFLIWDISVDINARKNKP